MSRCVQCGGRAGTRHHVLPQQHIKRYARSAVRAGMAVDRARLLTDGRNLVDMCMQCHQDHESWARRLTRDQVPASAWEFAAELGEWATVVLERSYPMVNKEAQVLVLSRKVGERVLIGDEIVVEVVEDGGRLKLGITAPPEVRVMREELVR